MKFFLVIIVASLFVFSNAALTKKEVGTCVKGLKDLSTKCAAKDTDKCVEKYEAWTDSKDATDDEIKAAAKCFTDLAAETDCKDKADADILKAGEKCTKEEDNSDNSTILSAGLLFVLAVLAL
mmetsp:Transcript_6579/g.594  ORF Transcript_6579/g.594 Transcript_6579/m.594 type:complete len:123 (-) Transcript_6579:35-403(-)